MIIKILISIIQDLFLLIGFLSTIYGTYLIYEPAGFIVGGILLLYAFRPFTNKYIYKKE